MTDLFLFLLLLQTYGDRDFHAVSAVAERLAESQGRDLRQWKQQMADMNNRGSGANANANPGLKRKRPSEAPLPAAEVVKKESEETDTAPETEDTGGV